MGLKWHKYIEKWEEKAVDLNCLSLECEVLLTRIAENNHKKGGHNLRKSGIPTQPFHE
jgi:hypothetical protein